jgi:hypothetical protein
MQLASLALDDSRELDEQGLLLKLKISNTTNK